MKILSAILILLSIFIGFAHGLGTLINSPSPESLKMMAEVGITEPVRKLLGVLSLTTALLVLFPKTFLFGNLLRIIMLITTMGLLLNSGNYQLALIEIPFLMMPLVLIYLGYPLKK